MAGFLVGGEDGSASRLNLLAIQYGTAANRPSTGLLENYTYAATDTHVVSQVRNGAWVDVLSGAVVKTLLTALTGTDKLSGSALATASITPVKLDANTAAKRQAFRTKIGIEDFSTTLTDSATIAWNLDTSEIAEVTLAGNRTLAVPTNGRDGVLYLLRTKQDSTGSRTLTLHSSIDKGDLDAPELSTAGGTTDVLAFMKWGSSIKYLGILLGY